MELLGPDEESRLDALRRLGILDTGAEEDFDNIIAVAAQVCGAPMAAVSLVDADRQWFKAHLGVSFDETPRELAFCGYTILQREAFVVHDALADERFAESPIVRSDAGIRFYAAVPLVTADGYAVGTLCVLDTKPRNLTDDQREVLTKLAQETMRKIELRRDKVASDRERDELETARRALLESEARYARLLDSIEGFAITSLDGSGRVVSWNSAAERTFGWTAPEIIGREIDALFPPDEGSAGVALRALGHARGEGRFEEEGWLARRNGERFWASLDLSAIGGDQPAGFTLVVQDVSERRRAEEARELLIARLVRAEEDERARIAAEIHDDTLQVLAAAGIRLHMLSREVQDPEQRATVDAVHESLQAAMRRLRDLVFDLRPVALDERGLLPAIREYAGHLCEGSDVRMTVTGTLRHEPERAVQALLFRLAREAVANACAHGHPTAVTVTVDGDERGTALTVRDDGAGFDHASAPPRPGHLGITLMRERAELAGGRVEIDSARGRGTTVRAWVPLEIAPG